MYTPVSDEILKKATSYHKLDYLHKAQEFLMEKAEYLGLQDFTFDPDHCSVYYANKWGVYSNKPVLYTDEAVITALSERISVWTNSILTNGLGYINRSEYKMAITHIQRYLTHLIPSQEALDQLLSNANDLLDKLDDSLILSDYTNWKKDQILAEGYVYAIVLRDEVVYIGYTARPLLARLKEHWSLIQEPISVSYDKKYEILNLHQEEVTFKLLYQVTTGITEFELKNIERALIEAYQPRFNKEGVTEPYGVHDVEYNRSKSHLPFYQDQLDNIANSLEAMRKEFEKFQKQMI